MIHSCISVNTTNILVGLTHAATFIAVENRTFNTLIDSCASENFISKKVMDLLSLRIFPLSKRVTMAQKSINSQCNGFVVVDFKLSLYDKLYTSVRFTIIKDLCCDGLGWEFQSRHFMVIFEYDSYLPELVKGTGVCLALEAADIAEPTLFSGFQLNAN